MAASSVSALKVRLWRSGWRDFKAVPPEGELSMTQRYQHSLRVILLGFFWACVVGVPIGILCGVSRNLIERNLVHSFLVPPRPDQLAYFDRFVIEESQREVVHVMDIMSGIDQIIRDHRIEVLCIKLQSRAAQHYFVIL
jgi:hypothetical protein